MIKVLGIGLSIALSFGVASAQSKPARKRPPAATKKPAKADPKPAATQPDVATDAKPVGTTASTTPDPGPAPANPDAGSPAAKAGTAPAPAGKPAAPLKTNEKAGTQLDRRGGTGDYRTVAPADEKAAEAAFREGNDRLNDGLFLKAAESYRKAITRWDHPAIHYNLALALINLDQPIEVYEHMTKALQYGAEPLEKDKFDHGKEYLRLVAGQLADIEVQCDKAGAKITVDGKEVFVAPGKFASKVRVGKHTFFADKEGYNARVETPFVGAGETFRINLKVYTTPELTRYSRKWDRAWLPYAVLGGGVAFVAAGGIVQALAQSDYDKFNQQVRDCGTVTQACVISEHKEITDVRDRADTKRTMGFVGYGIGAAAIATGAVLAYINRSRPYQITPEQLEGHQASARGSVAVVPIVSPEVMGATVQGHF